jgi:hypothetical protein
MLSKGGGGGGGKHFSTKGERLMNVTTKQNKTIIFIFTMQTYKVKDLIVLYNNVYQDNEISLKSTLRTIVY